MHSLMLSFALKDKMRHAGQTGISCSCLSSAKSALSEYSSDSLTLLTQSKKNVLRITTDKAKHQPWKQVKTLLVFSGFNPRANTVQYLLSSSFLVVPNWDVLLTFSRKEALKKDLHSLEHLAIVNGMKFNKFWC